MEKIRVIMIDSDKKEIREEFIENSLENLQKAVGGNIECAHRLPSGVEIYVNEEGLFKDGIINGFAVYKGHQPFAGNAIAVSFDKKGNTIGTEMNVSDMKMQIKFLQLASNF